MKDLETINQLERENYFDKSDWEEDDCSDEIPFDLHKKCEELERVFDCLCEGVNEKEAAVRSMNERDKKKIGSNDFIYGEITFRTLSYIISYILHVQGMPMLKEGIFYDLGSGSGRAVLSASLAFRFTKTIGIELLEELHLFSLKILDNINNPVNKTLLTNLQCVDINLIHGDILEYDIDYQNTSLIFMNCKTFSKDLMTSIADKLSKMPSGVLIITSSQLFSEFDSNWVLVKKMRKLMSWGCANIFIHVRK